MAVTKIVGSRQIKAGSITNIEQGFGTPSSDSDVAIKSYVDSVAQGLDVKPSVKLATIAPLSPANTYSNGTAGVGATLIATGVGTLTVDGVLTALNNLILVKNEASGLKNGIYKVTTAGAGGVAYVLTRVADLDASADYAGAFVFVEAGGSLSSTGWVCTTPAPLVGTDTISFSQFSDATALTEGNGIDISSGQVSIDTGVTVDKTTVQTLENKTLTSPVVNTPTGIVKGDVGLGSVDNTADAAKNVLHATTADSATTSDQYMRSTVVSGTQDDANKIFTIANAVRSGSEQVFINGQLLMPGASNDYVISATTVTFQAAFTAPASTDVIRVYGAY